MLDRTCVHAFHPRIAITAAVGSGGSPVTTGSVTFNIGGDALGTVSGAGEATLTATQLALGEHDITATNSGSAEHSTAPAP